MRARLLELDAVDAVPVVEGTIRWLPVRRPLGVRGFGTNAYSADAGEDVVEEHAEGPGHQEMYVVLRGRAAFRSDDDEVEVGAGSVIFYPEPDIRRGARALEDGTLVLAVGGNVGAPYEPAAWEHWFLAEPLARAGEYDKAAAILAAGLREHPRHARMHFYLACMEAQAGRTDDAMVNLRAALEADRDAIAGRASQEPDLEPLRERPDWPL